MDYRRDFRTGLTYSDVWKMLWVSDPDPSRWNRKNKGQVLSLFRSIKQAMWQEMYDRGLDPETLPPPPRPPRKVRRPLRKPFQRITPPKPVKAQTPARPLPALLSARAAARLLGVDADRILLDVARGAFPGAFKAGTGWRSWVIPLSDIVGPAPAPRSEAG